MTRGPNKNDGCIRVSRVFCFTNRARSDKGDADVRMGSICELYRNEGHAERIMTGPEL